MLLFFHGLLQQFLATIVFLICLSYECESTIGYLILSLQLSLVIAADNERNKVMRGDAIIPSGKCIAECG